MATATRTLGSFFISIQFIDDVFASVTAVTSKNLGGGLESLPSAPPPATGLHQLDLYPINYLLALTI